MEKDIESIPKVYEMFEPVEQLTEKILSPINKAIRSSFPEDGGDGLNPPRGRDLIARRRLHWLGERLEGKVQKYLADPTVNR